MSVFSQGDGDREDTSHTNDTTQPNQYTPRTYEDYQELRKAAPSKYYSANMQRRMYADAAKLGKDEFFRKSTNSKWWE